MSKPRLVFATRNPGKVREIAQMLSDHYDIVGLDAIGCTEDIPETAPTIPGNAIQKAEYVLEHYGAHCFADDTGLEVTALEGAPGVHTARYAGEAKDANANTHRLVVDRDDVADGGGHHGVEPGNVDVADLVWYEWAWKRASFLHDELWPAIEEHDYGGW